MGREWESRNGVANVGREWESRNGVANVGREWESRNGVANVGRKWESRNGVAKIKKIGAYVKGDPEGSNYLNKKIVRKICSVGNIGPGRLGPFFNRSVP